MSIASALNNAGTGLTAASRLAETVSNNVANAMTEGYARRTTELTSLTLGGYGSGVEALRTVRAENAVMTAERRGMDAAAAAASTLGAAYDRMLAAVGEPGTANALATRATALETALLGAVSSPQSSAKLSAAVAEAKNLVGSLNAIAAETAQMRLEADREIARQVESLNEGLDRIHELNAKIRNGSVGGLDTGALEDERGRIIDRITAIVPVRTVKREHGQLAIYTQNGAPLLDGRVFALAFEPGPAVITPDMTVAGGGLNGLQQDIGKAALVDIAIGTGTGSGPMAGGSLSALFEVRDRFAVEINAELDLYAQDLMQRFTAEMPAEALDLDGHGLFVDPAAGTLVGLAGRLTLNAAVDPAQGGEVRRLRDGLDGTVRAQGFADFLQGMADAMTLARAPAPAMISTSAANGASGFAAEIAAYLGGQAARGDENRAFLTAQQATLAEREQGALGVDTDAQLQFLMLVEQAYSANARVLTVVDSLLKELLEI